MEIATWRRATASSATSRSPSPSAASGWRCAATTAPAPCARPRPPRPRRTWYRRRMSGYATDLLLDTDTVSLREVACSGACRHRSPEECADATHLVFPYRGVFVRHVGRRD